MDFVHHCMTPLGPVTLGSDGTALIGLWFDGQAHDRAGLSPDAKEADLPVFQQAEAWLTLYFSGKAPDFTPPVFLRGTAFQKRVWALLSDIPRGQTATYGALASRLAAEGQTKVSPRAVGSAVGRNPLSLIVPCHRVVGADGRLTGYAGGLWRKEALLTLERTGMLPSELRRM